MKPIKMLGLAAVAALMAMALISASSAMAGSTLLCLEDAEPCPEHKIVKHVHETSNGQGKLLSSIFEVKCDVLLLGDVTSEGPPVAISGNFTYSNCTRENGKACEFKETSASASVTVLKTAHELAEVKYAYEFNIHCGVLINCTYDGEGLNGHGLGPLLSEKANGEVRLEGQVLHRVKGVCPETTELDLLTSPLDTVYIKSKSAMTCKSVSKGLYRGQVSAELCKEDVVGEWELVTTGGNMECVKKTSGLYVEQFSATECRRDALEDGTWELFS